MKPIYCLLTIFLFTNIHALLGQPITEENPIHLINGKLWISKDKNYVGTPLFLDQVELKGSVKLKTMIYENVYLGYDLEQGEIITTVLMEDNNKRIIAINKHVLDEISIQSTHNEYNFIRGDLISPYLNPQTYYLKIPFKKNPLFVLCKKSKKLEHKSGKLKYYQYNSIYQVRDSGVRKISSKGVLKKLLDLKNRKDVVKFIREHKLKIDAKHLDHILFLSTNFDL